MTELRNFEVEVVGQYRQVVHVQARSREEARFLVLTHKVPFGGYQDPEIAPMPAGAWTVREVRHG